MSAFEIKCWFLLLFHVKEASSAPLFPIWEEGVMMKVMNARISTATTEMHLCKPHTASRDRVAGGDYLLRTAIFNY